MKSNDVPYRSDRSPRWNDGYECALRGFPLWDDPRREERDGYAAGVRELEEERERKAAAIDATIAAAAAARTDWRARQAAARRMAEGRREKERLGRASGLEAARSGKTADNDQVVGYLLESDGRRPFIRGFKAGHAQGLAEVS